MANERQVFEGSAQPERNGRDDLVDAAAPGLADDVAHIVDVVGVVAGAAIHLVDTGAADQRVVAGAGAQRVVAAAAVHPVGSAGRGDDVVVGAGRDVPGQDDPAVWFGAHRGQRVDDFDVGEVLGSDLAARIHAGEADGVVVIDEVHRIDAAAGHLDGAVMSVDDPPGQYDARDMGRWHENVEEPQQIGVVAAEPVEVEPVGADAGEPVWSRSSRPDDCRANHERPPPR